MDVQHLSQKGKFQNSEAEKKNKVWHAFVINFR